MYDSPRYGNVISMVMLVLYVCQCYRYTSVRYATVSASVNVMSRRDLYV